MMLRLGTLTLVVVVLAFGQPVTQAADCTGCSNVTKQGEGFCCGKGLLFNVELASKRLYDALAGHKVDPSKVSCSGCKAAVKENGVCKGCNVGVAEGKAYHSMVSYKLAKGKTIEDRASMKCAGCRKSAEKDGFCTGCGVGFVAHRKFKSEKEYKDAKSAHTTLRRASMASTKCEGCAVAMVSDGTCAACKVRFEDGKPAKG